MLGSRSTKVWFLHLRSLKLEYQANSEELGDEEQNKVS